MAEITAKMVAELRAQTGAAMMLCKEALLATEGDFEEATVYIRKKLGKKLEGASDRSAGEGVIAVVVKGKQASIIELNSETDFVARNEDFKALAKEIAAHVLQHASETVEAALAQPSLVAAGLTLQDRLNDVYAKLRERILFKRFSLIQTDNTGVLAGYVHIPANDKIGVLVELGASSAEAAQSDALNTLGRDIAMHIAAAKPKYLTREEVPETILAQEQDIARTAAINEGRPEAALPKIIEGRIRKFYEEVVLLDQLYVRDPKKTIAQILQEAGSGVTIRQFLRYTVGDAVKGVETSGEFEEQAE
jgi:elongation factor Ts